MFEYLSGYRHVLVTGPYRSGTRIATKMIAHDLKYGFIDEAVFDKYDDKIVARILDTSLHLAIHGPGLLGRSNQLSRGDMAIVLMRRPIEQILRSEQRINWKPDDRDLSLYRGSEAVIASVVKYDYWESFLKERIHHPFEVEYESLKGHPLWVDEELRQGFKGDQTTLLGEEKS